MRVISRRGNNSICVSYLRENGSRSAACCSEESSADFPLFALSVRINRTFTRTELKKVEITTICLFLQTLLNSNVAVVVALDVTNLLFAKSCYDAVNCKNKFFSKKLYGETVAKEKF